LKKVVRNGARQAERQARAEVLERVQWDRVKAARILQVCYKISAYEMTPTSRGQIRSRSGQ
jgi:hypothetical protein